jgi:hypothetical protein
MRRTVILVGIIGAVACVALWLLLQIPGSLGETLSNPFASLRGTQKILNAKLLEVSESAEPVRSAGHQLLKPLGIVRLDRIYESPDTSSQKKPQH